MPGQQVEDEERMRVQRTWLWGRRAATAAPHRAGGKGVVFSPAYAGMNLANLDGAADALKELGLV